MPVTASPAPPVDDLIDRLAARTLVAVVDSHRHWSLADPGGGRVPRPAREIAAARHARDALLHALVDCGVADTPVAARSTLELVAGHAGLLTPDPRSPSGYDPPRQVSFARAHTAVRRHHPAGRGQPVYRSPAAPPHADGIHALYDPPTGLLYWLQDAQLYAAPPAVLPGQVDLARLGPVPQPGQKDLAGHLWVIEQHLREHAGRPGPAAVFSGGWWRDADGTYRIAFTGRRVGTRDGYAEFTATRSVVEAIVAGSDQPALPRLRFTGEHLVVAGDGEEAHVCPDRDGRYRIGFGWCWEQIHPDQATAVIT